MKYIYIYIYENNNVTAKEMRVLMQFAKRNCTCTERDESINAIYEKELHVYGRMVRFFTKVFKIF